MWNLESRGERWVIQYIAAAAAAAAKSLQSCPTLCNPIEGSPPGSPVLGILQARTLEWVAIAFSKAWKWKVKVKSLSHAQLLATPWTAAIFRARVLERVAIAFSGFSVYQPGKYGGWTNQWCLAPSLPLNLLGSVWVLILPSSPDPLS